MRFVDDAGDDYVEVMAELLSPGGRSTLTEWCAAQKLACTPMAEGVLISGSRTRFEAAFSQVVPDRARPTRLALPPELRGIVESLIILPVPHLHGNQASHS